MVDNDPRQLLEQAGWSDDRRVDPGLAVSRLEAEDYVVPSRATGFIANVDGVRIDYARGGSPDSIWFDVAKVLTMIFKEWVDEYSGMVEAPLVPVGYSNREHLLLLVSEAGWWFGGYEDEFGRLGRDVLEAVDTIANDRGFQDLR